MDRVLALQAGNRGLDSHRGHMSKQFFRSNRLGYPHPVSSELKNQCGIRVAVGDCSVTECRQWSPPYQTGKTVHVHAKHYKHKEDGRMVQNCTCARKTLQTQRGRTHGARCVRQWFRTPEPLGERRYKNWNIHTCIHTHTLSCNYCLNRADHFQTSSSLAKGYILIVYFCSKTSLP